MTLPLRTFLGMLSITIIAAALAGWLGVQYGLHQVPTAPDLDRILHQSLDLSASQDRRIEQLESAFAVERNLLNAEMRAANRELSAAIADKHTYGPKAQHAIERFHRAMMALQEDTVRHVLSMRAILTPAQAHQFDRIVAKALTDPS